MTADRRLRILQVSSADVSGGAEKVALELHSAYRADGHDATLAVGRRRRDAPGVITIPNDAVGSAWSRAWWKLHGRLQPWYRCGGPARWACRVTHRLAAPRGALERFFGREDFNYPGTWALLEAYPATPDVLHCHNLHGGYFDLRALADLSARAPTILTLHDAWLLTGHCAHSFDCERWKTGCGHCPDLTIYPAIRRDATAGNWRRKQDIYRRSRLHIATPCRWLMSRVEDSMLAAGACETRVIPYGVDLSIFRPGDRLAARTALRLPHDSTILLMSANSIRSNPWKDFATLRAALSHVAGHAAASRTIVVALGEAAASEFIGPIEVRFVPYTFDARVVALHLHAADAYVHPARVDTFPNAILEALACGVPVVASAAGGISEQIRAAEHAAHPRTLPTDDDRACGLLVPAGDPAALASALRHIIDEPRHRLVLAGNASRLVQERFDQRRHVADYLAWYRELSDRRRAGETTRRTAPAARVAAGHTPTGTADTADIAAGRGADSRS
jgi:glycosyltransferase involved in cell wall biosynthesis